MVSHIFFIVSGLAFVIFTSVVQSAPIDKTKQVVQSASDKQQTADGNVPKLLALVKSATTSPDTTTNPTVITVSQSSPATSNKTPEKADHKRKRFIDDELYGFWENDPLSNIEEDSSLTPGLEDDNHYHTFNSKVQETSAKIHDNTDRLVDTDDSKLFSDVQMTPSELTDIVRRRRDVKLHDDLSKRRKRSALPHEYFETESFDDPFANFFQPYQYDRSPRSFAPIYWYPNTYDRNIRSAITTSVYESEYPRIYTTSMDSDESDESIIPVSEGEIVDEDDDEYESNRFPVLVQLSDDPLDNFKLQDQYNRDDLPTDDDSEQIWNDSSDDDDLQNHLFYRRQPLYYDVYVPSEEYF